MRGEVMYRQLKQTAFEMLSRTQAYSRIRSLITKALTRRACSPGDVDACNVVGIVLKSTLSATKESLRTAVLFLAMLATRARSGGVARINRHNGYALQGRFVFEERPKHRVRPQVVFVAGRFCAPCRAFSEVRQVLNGERVAGRE